MRTIFTLFRKDMTLFFKNRMAVTLAFLIPIAMIFLFGQIFGVNRQGHLSRPVVGVAIVAQAPSTASNRMIAAFQSEKGLKAITKRVGPDGAEQPLTEADVREGMKGDAYHFAVILPADFVSDQRLGIRLRFLSNPRSEIEAQAVNGLVHQTIFSAVPRLLGKSFQDRFRKAVGAERADELTASVADAIVRNYGGNREEIIAGIKAGDVGTAGNPADMLAQLVNVENEQVGGREVSSAGATRLVGGWAIQFLLFALTVSAVVLFMEKQQGLFQRLLSGPVSRAQILWSKFFYGVALGVFQLVVLFFAGHFLYGIDVMGHFGNLLVVCIAAASACTAFGMLIAAISSSVDVARGLATFSILVMSALGGAWFPTSFMPALIQHFSKWTITYWSIEGFIRVLWAGDTLLELLPVLAVLFGITAVVMAIATWRFNRGRLFD